jgi:hypothetical protein
VACLGIVEDGSFFFLNENEYAGGGRKRRRGPNVTTAAATATATAATPTPSAARPVAQEILILASPRRAASISEFPNHALDFGTPPTKSPSFDLSPTLDIPLDVQALAYYAHIHVDVPHGVPEAMDGHLRYALIDWSRCAPDSILSLAVSAVAHATFGRAQKSHAALAVGSWMYSNALIKTNMALRDTNEVAHDGVLLAAMLLSYYENSVTDKISNLFSRDIKDIGARSFAHHDGAMALLKLRRQRGWSIHTNMELDKLVRRQLMRTLVLRHMPLPPWLRDGSQYGETGYALELDRYMVIVAKLRHQVYVLSMDTSTSMVPVSKEKMAQIRVFLAEAKALDSALARWARSLPPDMQYSSVAVHKDLGIDSKDRPFNSTVHIYPTVGHAGLWNRYRALRIAVNALIPQTLSTIPVPLELEMNALEDTVENIIRRLTEDICESVPFTLDLIENKQIDGQNHFFVKKSSTPFGGAIKASTAYFICWPLALVITIPDIPEGPRQYLRRRLLDVSEIVDDGVLERLATTSVHNMESRIKCKSR